MLSSPQSEVSKTPRALFFRLGGVLFALEGAHARQVVSVPGVTPVPRTPRELLGLFTSGGALLPLVNPRPLLGLAEGDGRGSFAPDPATYDLAVLAQAGPHTLALSVDEVAGFATLERGAMLPLSGDLPEAFHRYGLGRWVYEGQDVVVLDVLKIAERLGETLAAA